jgi:hypothetical protein
VSHEYFFIEDSFHHPVDEKSVPVCRGASCLINLVDESRSELSTVVLRKLKQLRKSTINLYIR